MWRKIKVAGLRKTADLIWIREKFIELVNFCRKVKENKSFLLAFASARSLIDELFIVKSNDLITALYTQYEKFFSFPMWKIIVLSDVKN